MDQTRRLRVVKLTPRPIGPGARHDANTWKRRAQRESLTWALRRHPYSRVPHLQAERTLPVLVRRSKNVQAER
jgi:hypothetical protein